MKLNDLLTVLDDIAPFGLAEPWDNVGLMVGDPDQQVSGVLAALDLTEEILDEAVSAEINTIVTHHPMIFKPLSSVRTDLPTGRLLMKALGSEIAVIGCHTNLDIVSGGVNDILAAKLGLEDTKPLVSKEFSVRVRSDTGAEPTVSGLGRIGSFSDPVESQTFLEHLAGELNISVLRISGRLPAKVNMVAVCGGSGSDLAEIAFSMGAQVYVTGEVKHSVARWAEAVGFCIIDAGHFATENQIVPVLVSSLQSVLAERGLDVKIQATTSQQSPWHNYVMHGS
ncbi:MAG: Nif3-like dinuclear metal center hexameric protein [Desulfobulbaceae bacterium]|nr:Nif3-like dinuclear metal center hexameric protein [Desulfobulbaceae bacterium]